MLECSEAWRKGGPTAKPASSILRLLGALDELPAAAMLNASYAMEGMLLLCLQHFMHDCKTTVHACIAASCPLHHSLSGSLHAALLCWQSDSWVLTIIGIVTSPLSEKPVLTVLVFDCDVWLLE